MGQYKTWRKLLTPEIWLFVILFLQSCTNDLPEKSEAVSSDGWLLDMLAADDSLYSDTAQSHGAFTTQPSSRASSLVIKAIISPGDDQSEAAVVQAGLIATLSRVALPKRDQQLILEKSSSDTALPQSQWSFEHVLHSHVLVDVIEGADALFLPLASVDPATSVQRSALNLAGSSMHRLWVGNNSVQIDPVSSSTLGQCHANYSWQSQVSATHQLRLTFAISRCPDTAIVDDFNQWQLSGLSAEAYLDEIQDGEPVRSIPLNARVWLQHTWGNSATPGGAVVFDTLSIELGRELYLDISRSKRRSGKGPKTIVAYLQEADSPPRAIDLQWQDSEEWVTSASGERYPQSVFLSASEENIELKVQAMNRLIESDSPFGQSLHVPVTFSGSYSGAGFMNFMAIPQNANND